MRHMYAVTWVCFLLVVTSCNTSDALLGSGSEASTPICTINASDYNQSCSTASDCVSSTPSGLSVSFGNYCAMACFCPTAFINQSAVPQYIAALSMTPLGTDAGPDEKCNCGSLGSPCCQDGQCAMCTPPQAAPSDASTNPQDTSNGVIIDGSNG